MINVSSHIQINFSKHTAMTRQKNWRKCCFINQEFPAEPFPLCSEKLVRCHMFFWEVEHVYQDAPFCVAFYTKADLLLLIVVSYLWSWISAWIKRQESMQSQNRTQIICCQTAQSPMFLFLSFLVCPQLSLFMQYCNDTVAITMNNSVI